MKKKRNGELRIRDRGQRWVDNQSTESSFHTHTSSKPMEFALVAVERGKREGRERERKKDFDFIWQPETPSHSLYQKGREAWSVHCHKINTDTKSKEAEIKRVIDVEIEKVNKTGRKKARMKEKGENAKWEREMDTGEKE